MKRRRIYIRGAGLPDLLHYDRKRWNNSCSSRNRCPRDQNRNIFIRIGITGGGDCLYKESSTLPQLEEIQAQLNEDEIAVAEELVLNYGADFDPASDFTKIAYNDDKVKISFKEAVNEKLEAFNTEVPGKYQAVYEVVPLRDSNMAYQIVRYITVNDKEPETAGHGENNGGEDKNTEETDDDSDSDPAQQNEISEESESTEPETSADSPMKKMHLWKMFRIMQCFFR